MAVFREMQIGNTKIRLHDDYCVSPAEAEKIVADIAKWAYPIVTAELLRRQQQQNGGDAGNHAVQSNT